MLLESAETQLQTDSFSLSSKKNKSHNIRVLLITPYKIVQESLKMLIEDNFRMYVTANNSDLNKLTQNYNFDSFDVILIYLTDGNNETLQIISKIIEISPSARIIVAANGKDFVNQSLAIELGAVGIVQKEQNSKTLISSIRQVHRGEACVNQVLLSKLLTDQNTSKNESPKHYGFGIGSLSKREKEVITMIGEGLNNKALAKRLFVSEATIRHHLSSIFRKLEVEDRLNLVIYAYQHELIKFLD